MESRITNQWEIDRIKVVLLVVLVSRNEEYLVKECNRLFSEHSKQYKEVVIFFFNSVENVDDFTNLFLSNLKDEELSLKESGCYAKFIGSSLIFNEKPGDIDYEKFLNHISISQTIGIENYKIMNYVNEQVSGIL